MHEREFERVLERLMGRDNSVGSEAFRDALLERCLEVLNADEGGSLIDDDVLDLLAAAGDPSVVDDDALWPEGMPYGHGTDHGAH